MQLQKKSPSPLRPTSNTYSRTNVGPLKMAKNGRATKKRNEMEAHLKPILGNKSTQCPGYTGELKTEKLNLYRAPKLNTLIDFQN